jgi:hypothetical protein
LGAVWGAERVRLRPVLLIGRLPPPRGAVPEPVPEHVPLRLGFLRVAPLCTAAGALVPVCRVCRGDRSDDGYWRAVHE